MGSALSNLNEELKVEILFKLSLKSLIRCRCVCQSWNDLISSPDFIRLHLIKNQNHNYVLLVHPLISNQSETTLSFLDYESLRTIETGLISIPVVCNYNVNVSGPCNGLICISSSDMILLCNPSLRESSEIPFPLPQYKCLGYHAQWMFCGGLGFDSTTNQYKVVSFVRLFPNFDQRRYPGLYIQKTIKIQCLIYDVGIRRWREVDQDMSYIHEMYYVTRVLYKGVLHWFVKIKDISTGNLSTFILCFNVSTEMFRHIRVPNNIIGPSVRNKQCRLIAFNDSLAIVVYDDFYRMNFTEDQVIEIWVLKQDEIAEPWTRQKQFNVGPGLFGIDMPLSFRKNEIILVKAGLRRLVSLNLDTNERNYYDIDNAGDKVLVYQESLVSIM